MAGDLIPPPSPAGRPDPAAPERERAEPRPQEALGAVAADPPPGPSRYRSRFGFLLGALAGIAVATIAVVALIVGGGARDDGGPAWSQWRPTSEDRLVRAAEIAQHVGREYRLNDGSQLVDVEAGPLAIDDVPLTPVVRTAAKGGDIVPIYGDGILYVLNGLGDRGSIAREEPSAKRLALVKREAVELAMYTFRYVDGVDHVVAMLPPAPKTAPAATGSGSGAAGGSAAADATQAAQAASGSGSDPIPTMLFRPGDLRAQLSAPLAATFPTAPPRPATLSDAEQELLSRFTDDNVFNAAVVPSQTGQGFLVLDRPRTTTGAEQLLESTIPKSGK